MNLLDRIAFRTVVIIGALVVAGVILHLALVPPKKGWDKV